MPAQDKAIGFASIFIGGILGIAGLTGSSIHSIVQGKPDKTKLGSEGSTGAESFFSFNPGKGLISPFSQGEKVIWGRSDQGIDGQIKPGGALGAMGSGTIEIAHDPNGFGTDYPVLHLDNGESYYYGHIIPSVKNGQRVRQGQVIGHTSRKGWGNATTPGWFEIGRWPPGNMSSGQLIREWFTKLPR